MRPPVGLQDQALYMWVAHKVKANSAVEDSVAVLGSVTKAYSLALEVVASAQSRIDGKFAQITPLSKKRDSIINGFIVGLTLVETAILGGYNAQAAALIRQEMEGIAALEEVRIGIRADGKTPNIRHVKSVPKAIYGDLSRIAHFCHAETLRCTTAFTSAMVEAPGPSEACVVSPTLIPETMRRLFALHVLLTLHLAEHQAEHILAQHGVQSTNAEISMFNKAQEMLTEAGLIYFED